MINFDRVDFSEHRSEEVMFLLTLSVACQNIDGGTKLVNCATIYLLLRVYEAIIIIQIENTHVDTVYVNI